MIKLPLSYWRPVHPQLPRLFLAPMEGVGDALFRKAYASVGGMDEMSTEFLRVPSQAHVRSLAKKYHPPAEELSLPLACQLMGQDPDLLTQMAQEVYFRGAPRIDLNCGCPSNTVVGRGAGSSLLKTPDTLYKIIKNMSFSLPIPVTVKMRSGFSCTRLFFENLQAIEEGGASFLSLHPRTKTQGYQGKADWSLIAKACEFLSIPVVGNGDILSCEDMQSMMSFCPVQGIMIGRGALIRPWIFQDIKARYLGTRPPSPLVCTLLFLKRFLYLMQESQVPEKTQINRLKQSINYLFQNSEAMKEDKKQLLSTKPLCSSSFYQRIVQSLERHLGKKQEFSSCGEKRITL